MRDLNSSGVCIESLEGRRMLSAVVPQTDFFVSPGGNDSNIGSIAKPFRTLDRARDVVRTVDQHMTRDIHVVLRGGTYTLNHPLVLDSRDSGTNGFKVVWQAYAKEQPIVSGGKTITGWTLHDGSKNIWQAPVGSLQTRQLYVNNQRAELARSTGTLPGKVALSSTGYTTSDLSLQKFKRPLDLEFVYTGGRNAPSSQAWKEQILTASSISGTSKQTNINLRPMRGLPSNPAALAGVPSYLQNAYELLSKPGQWYLDHTAQMLYYIPRAGENMTAATVVAPALETLLQGNGTLNSPIHNITFSGLSFEYATWLGPTTSHGFVDAQANWNFQGDRMPANISFTAAHNIDFEQNRFTNLGSAGLDLFNGSQNNIINANVFTDIAGSGIQLGDVIHPNPTDARAKDAGNRITNNAISNVADQYHGGVGIFAGYVASTIISHNEINNLPYSGISIGWGWSVNSNTDMVDNQVTFNNIHHVMQLLWDGGGIYTNGHETHMLIQNNYIHDIPEHGIYEDEGSSFIETSNNVIAQVQYWIFIWTSSIHDLYVHNNFTDTPQYLNNGFHSYVSQTTVFSSKAWPAAALSIIANAGIQKGVVLRA